MAYAADLHVHSPYSYACSKNLTLENLSAWARLKGIDLLASADFTHPRWHEELRRKLVPAGLGLFRYGGIQYVLGTEVSCVYSQGGRNRRVHLLLYVPDFETVENLIRALTGRGTRLETDGRPTLRVSARDLTALALDINSECIVVPAHVWTPWYGLFGAKSGFDHLEECFQDMTSEIPALESGLSSDPAMMWPIKELADKTIVSFSDAHSPQNLGREATVFEGELSYLGLSEALFNRRIAYTVEYYPEEGKYHYNGHRKCGVVQSPEDTQRLGTRCPVCGRLLTLGVLHRVRSMWDGDSPGNVNNLRVTSPQGDRPPFLRLVPLREVIAQTLGQGKETRRVEAEYGRVTRELGSELEVLKEASRADLENVAGERLAQAILRVRKGHIHIDPGYDGVYGTVNIWPEGQGERPTESPVLAS